VIAIHEIAEWLSQRGVEGVSGMNHGGTQVVDGLQVTMTPAVLSSSESHPSTSVPSPC
jgi:L-ascorbate metabolism protein UlaG (beta-lactamase superfamily)